MIGSNDRRPCAGLLRTYQTIIDNTHRGLLDTWPLLNGWNLLSGRLNGWDVAVFKDAPYSNVTRQDGIGEVSAQAAGTSSVTPQNRDLVRSRLEQFFNIGQRDCVVLYPPDNDPQNDMQPEFAAMLQRHEAAMGVSAMKIFLSHKGLDKPQVREFKNTLQLLGFDSWLDEDAMPAGTPLERGILQGFSDSCAAVFFVTPNFKDEAFLATEVDYAIEQKRKKNDKFAIITLVFGEGEAKGTVPDLLHRFVWKEPKSNLEAFDEIIKALPIKVGAVSWR